jgi:hypothetical protein
LLGGGRGKFWERNEQEMKQEMKSMILICLVLFLTLPVFNGFAYCNVLQGINSEFISGPTLLYPTTDNISLARKEYLQFKWEMADQAQTDYFDFRLYKGYNTSEENLLFKQHFSTDAYPIQVPASQFEKGQVYTWVLVQVYLGGKKSDKGFSSFKIIDK